MDSALTPFYIDWSRGNVSWLWDHSGRPEDNMPVLRNAHVFFTNGVTWTLARKSRGAQGPPATTLRVRHERLAPHSRRERRRHQISY